MSDGIDLRLMGIVPASLMLAMARAACWIRCHRWMGGAALMVAVLVGRPTHAQTFDFTTTSLGVSNADWSALVWSPDGSPNGAGVTVGLDLNAAARTLTIDQNVTLGGMRFYNADATTLQSGQITWDTGQTGVVAELGRNRGLLTSIVAGRGFTISTSFVLTSDLRVTNWTEGNGSTARGINYNSTTSGAGKLTLRLIPWASGNTVNLVFGGSTANTHAGGTTIVGDINTQTGTAAVRLATTISKNDAFGTGVLAIEGSTPVDLDLNARSATVAGLVGSVGSGDHLIRNASNTTASTLTLKLIDNATTTYARALGSRTIGSTLYAGNNLNLVIDKADGATGTGIQTLSGVNTYTGTTTLAGGTLALGSADAMNGGGTVTFTGGTVRHDSAAAGIDLGSRIQNSSDLIRVNTNNNDVSYAGIDSSNVAGLEKLGDGTLTLTGVNTYSGGTFVDAGTLAVTAANALGTGNVTVANGARLQLDVSPALGGGSLVSLATGAELVTVGGVAVPIASGSSLSGWSSTSPGGTAANLLQATADGNTTLSSGWTTNPGAYLSDILTLSGTTASNSNVMVLSLAYDPGYLGDLAELNIFTRPDSLGTFTAVGSDFVGVGSPWTAAFQTPGQYGVSEGRVWAVTDTNSQFVVDVSVVPEPGTLAIAAWGSVAAGLYFRRRRRLAR